MISELSELALRCERGRDADRKLDDEIGIATGSDPVNRNSLRCTTGKEDAAYANFTASIDAAMSLRPPGWSYTLKTAEHHENGFEFWCWVSWGPIAYRRISAQAATEARAISAGWLRAYAGKSV